MCVCVRARANTCINMLAPSYMGIVELADDYDMLISKPVKSTKLIKHHRKAKEGKQND